MLLVEVGSTHGDVSLSLAVVVGVGPPATSSQDPVGIQVTIHMRAALGGSGPEYLGDAATCDEAP